MEMLSVCSEWMNGGWRIDGRERIHCSCLTSSYEDTTSTVHLLQGRERLKGGERERETHMRSHGLFTPTGAFFIYFDSSTTSTLFFLFRSSRLNLSIDISLLEWFSLQSSSSFSSSPHNGRRVNSRHYSEWESIGRFSWVEQRGEGQS